MHRWFYTTSQSALVQIYAEQPILHIAALSSLIQGVPFKVELRSLTKINSYVIEPFLMSADFFLPVPRLH